MVRHHLLEAPFLAPLVIWLESVVAFLNKGCAKMVIPVAFSMKNQVKKKSSLKFRPNRQGKDSVNKSWLT